MNELSDAQVGVAVAGIGTLSVSIFVSYLVDVLHDYFPQLSGRWAIGAVDAVAFVTTLGILIAVDSDWTNPVTYGAIGTTWLAARTLTRGVYEHKKQQRGG